MGKSHEETIYNAKGEKVIIVKGAKAKLGSLGGCAGVGGQAGFSGMIEIKTEREQNAAEVVVKAKNGNEGVSGKSGRIGENCGKDNVDYFQVIDAFGNLVYSSPIGRYNYEIAYSDTEREASIYDDKSDVYVFAKRSHEVSSIRTRSNDYEFFINLISVLRNSYRDFDFVQSILNLKSYRNGLISIIDVAKNCQSLNLHIPHLETLKAIAENVNYEDPVTKGFIQKQIKNFIVPKRVTVEGSAVEVVKKIITSAEIEEFFADHNEVRVICDTFHVDKDLPSSARGKIFIILAKYIEIHGKVTWNLSGRDEVNIKHNKAKECLDGIDGKAGQNGGNCEITCKFIENSSSLRIISNGADGTDGQDGGDGVDGSNGIDAEKNDFYVGINVFETSLANMDIRLAWADKNDYRYREYLKSDRSIKRKFWFIAKPIHSAWGFMLVRGSDGTKGTAGGIGGYGGKGGHEGEINIKCENKVSIEANVGRNGKEGKDGKNGANGRDGRDAYR